MVISIQRYAPPMKMEWDGLIGTARNAIFQFKRDYMDYHADRFLDFSFVAFADGRMVAAMPASIDEATGAVRSHAGLTFGGVVVERTLRGDAAMDVVGGFVNLVQERGARSLEVKLLPAFLETYPSGDIGYALWRNGLDLVRRDLSSIIPLNDPVPLNSLKRRALVKAANASVELATGSLTQFHELLSRVLSDQHGASPVHSLNDLERLTLAFPKNIFVRSAVIDGDMIAAALVYRYDTAWHTQYLASSERGRACGGLDVVIAGILEEARRDGVRYVSLGASTTDEGRELNAGLLFQKESFGARSVTHDFVRRNFNA